MRRRGFASLLVMLIAATIAFAQADSLIVPGQRIATVAVGMSTNEAIAAGIIAFGGSPEAASDCTHGRDREAGIRCIYRRWREPGDVIHALMLRGVPGQERVLAISTRRVAHRTAEGLGVGTPFAEVVKLYGTPQTASRLPVGYGYELAPRDWENEGAAWWPGRGLGIVYLLRSGPVVAVVVFAPMM